ncbi:derriere protein isoform X1 [Tachysurus fulvidraco]|uniref:derriere protein isoform X1 n=1 Tax=Tachysurus fulvidraco TaxID=1234273 RepID=UPI000F4DCD96|nr:derriere protein isoform X1 [Tachysurus fulvidraco]
MGVVSYAIKESMSGVSSSITMRASEKKFVMQNLATQCYVVFAWLVVFSSSLRVSRTAQDYTGTNQTLQLEAIKTSMLEYLGMDRPPPPSRGKSSFQELIKIYRQYQSLRRNMQSFQSGSSFFLHTTVQPLTSQQNSPESVTQWFRAVFHRESHITDEFLLAQAQLQLQRPLDNNFDQPLRSQKTLVRIHITTQSYMEKVFSSKKLQSRGHNVTMDVTFAVTRWLGKTSNSLLIVDIGFVRKKEGETESTPQIFLELKLMEGKMRKARSTYGEDFEEDSYCSRKSLSVSFEEIGWSDWIVAPAGYTMYFCDGSCPHNYKPASMHTQIKSRLHRLTKGATPRPCCVPADYEPMILMHYDSRGKLKLTSFNDLIVTKCHCA